MFEYIIQELERGLYITKFLISKPGFEGRHNLMYWDNAIYGVGGVNGVRYKNHGPIRHYMQAVDKGNARVQEHLTQTEMMEEEMCF